MNSVSLAVESPVYGTAVQNRTQQTIDGLMASLPISESLTAEQRRGIIARYSAVLEGNFIYWMTGAYLSVRTDEARTIILENLHEEVRDCHPGMMRRFAIAAHSVPTERDFLAVYQDLSNVRLFVGRLSPVPLLLMMGFFEGFIQRFMAFLEDLSTRQGSAEREYTQVHGVCDIAHTAGLFRALAAEIAAAQTPSGEDLFEGVGLLSTLIRTIVDGPQNSACALPS
jgi:hypothetical protein